MADFLTVVEAAAAASVSKMTVYLAARTVAPGSLGYGG